MSPIPENLLKIALGHLYHHPTDCQLEALRAGAALVADSDPRSVLVINGYAGTGKTSVVASLIRAADEMRRRVVILAPTGRAANVAARFSNHQASTIHRRLFRPAPGDPDGSRFILAPNQLRDALFVVDEASLIPDSGDSDILALLIRYVYSAPGCRMILVGDDAQLPPVGQTSSSALSPERLAQFGLNPSVVRLDEVVRQQAESGIVMNATLTRGRLGLLEQDAPPFCLDLRGFSDVSVVSTAELADLLTSSYSEVGVDETIVITRSNKRANNFNNAIRNTVLYAEGPLERGDRLIVAKNDYFWPKENKLKTRLVANGDAVGVEWVGECVKMYGRFFTEAELRLSDGSLMTAQIMLRSLACDGPSIPRHELLRFHSVVMDAYEGAYTEKLASAMSDAYYNALQVKYGYCVTCHKAQGGQWRHVYIDMGGIDPESVDSDFYRWLYTALTRATGHVFLINPTVPILGVEYD